MSVTHTVPLSEKTFTHKHLEISKIYINTKVWPGLYNNKQIKEFKTLKFVDRRIMAIKDITYDIPDDQLDQYPATMRQFVTNNKMMIQTARASGRGLRAHDVWASMRKYGYELSHIPMCVVQMMDGKNHFCDGRTRLEELLAQKFTHIIVDFYNCSDWHTFTSFALFRNPPDKARSPQTLNDVITNGVQEIKAGRLKDNEEDVSAYVKLVTDDGYDESNYGKILKGILAGKTGQSSSLNDRQAEDWLITNGYLNDIKGNGIYYFVVSVASLASSILAAANELDRLTLEGANVKKLRIVINPGTIKGADPERSWKKGVDSFRKTYHDSIELLKNSYFSNAKYMNIIELYGVIPTVHSLAQTYPLNKIVEFNQVFKKYKTFVDLDGQNGLTELIIGT